ncbi:MAG TPA: ABC transporter permease [Thermodesulfobacteriota bacterium]|nr:ABC transporter permease [Thermodesulfobacteriota bacterium]
MKVLESSSSLPSFEALKGPDGTLTMKLSGRLDAYTTGKIWNDSYQFLKSSNPPRLIIDAGGLDYCDASGIGFLIELKLMQEGKGGSFELTGLNTETEKLYKLFKPEMLVKHDGAGKGPSLNPVEKVGRASWELLQELNVHIYFTGRVTVGLLSAAINPARVRWKDVFVTCEKFGANSLFIIALVNFLVGLVIAFQSAIPMQQYGAQIFVADLIVIAYFKELGPLMTAFVVNGRSGSAFAAELGTMKVNEELDALDTMGLDAVNFLVVPKVIAALFMLPVLTVFGNLFGLLGGLVVMLSMGFTVQTYINQITASGTYEMLLAGLFKTLFFAVLIAGVGCLSGMRASRGPSAVGDAATSAVVTGIILMIVIDGIFGVIYYILGI